MSFLLGRRSLGNAEITEGRRLFPLFSHDQAREIATDLRPKPGTAPVDALADHFKVFAADIRSDGQDGTR
jgi:hypothetical protein